MKYTILLLFATVLIGCNKAPILYRATLFNPTDHDIKILFYKEGVVHPNDTISLTPNSEFPFAYGAFGRGAKEGIGFLSDYFGGSDDSMIVIFDNQYQITHYLDTPPNLAKHYYLFSSLRNIGNPYSYEYAVLKENGDIINDHKYCFTEQDYLDAKD